MHPVTLERWLEAHVPRFLENRRKDLDTLAAALAKKDFAAVATVGKALQTLAPGFSMDALTQVGVDLQEAAREGSEDKVRAGMLAIGRFLAALRIVYR